MSGWTIEAKVEPLLLAAGHLYFEIWRPDGNRYAQLHGYSYSINDNGERIPHPIGFDGDPLGSFLYYNGVGTNPNATRESHPHDGIVVFSGTKSEVIAALSEATKVHKYINDADLLYHALAKKVDGAEAYNSNSVFSAFLDAFREVISIPSDVVDEAYDLGIFGFNPGVTKKILIDDEWNSYDSEVIVYEPLSSRVTYLVDNFGREDAILINIFPYVDNKQELVWVAGGNIIRQIGVFQESGLFVASSEIHVFPSDNGSNAALSITYADNDGDGLVDGVPSDFDIIGPDFSYTAISAATQFGSQIGSILAGDSHFEQLSGRTLGAVIGQELGHLVGDLSHSILGTMPNATASILDTAVDHTLAKSGGVTVSTAGGISTQYLGSLLMAEAAEALGLEGFEGQVFTEINGQLTGQVLYNLGKIAAGVETVTNAAGKTVPLEWDYGISWEGIGTAFVNTGLSALGVSPSDVFFDIDNVAEQIYVTIGGIVGAAIGNVIPVVGSAIGSYLGQIVGSITYETLDFLTFGTIGEWFDDEPWHYVWPGVDGQNPNHLKTVFDASDETDAALRNVTFNVTDAYTRTFNQIIDDIGAEVDWSNFNLRGYQAGGTIPILDHANFGYHHSDGAPYGDDKFKLVLGSDELYINVGKGPTDAPDFDTLLRIALEYEFSKIELIGGDQILVAAFNKWQDELHQKWFAKNGARSADEYYANLHAVGPSPTFPLSPGENGKSLSTLYTYLQIAKDYSHYLKNTEKINGLITALPDTAFSAGWLATLVRAEEMGLNEGYHVAYDASRPQSYVGLDRPNVISTADGNDFIQSHAGGDSVRAHGGDDTVNGGGGADVLQLDNGDDQAWGGLGADTILGGTGNDTLAGGAGSDRLNGGPGFDVASYFDGNEGVVIGLTGDPGVGGEAQGDVLQNIEQIIGSQGNDHLSGSDRNDPLYGSGGSDTLEGGAGSDSLFGEEGDDHLFGEEGDDTLFGWTGNDILLGGDGVDTLSGQQGNDTLRGGKQNDLLVGDSEGDTGDDLLFGDEGDDTLGGGDGNDGLFGGAGDDKLFGWNGADTLTGGLGNDHLLGDAGNDTLNGGAGADSLYGGAENDSLSGGEQQDSLFGDDGNDTIHGGASHDTAFAWDGDDHLFGDDGDDTLAGEKGNDIVDGGAGNDVITGDGEYYDSNGQPVVWSGDDTLTGGLGNDFIWSGAGNDLVSSEITTQSVAISFLAANEAGIGRSGDTVFGEAGDDTIHGSSRDDLLNSGADDDSVFGAAGSDTILGYQGADHLAGGDGADILYGLADNDTLDGNQGADTLFGDVGADYMDGGGDDDGLDGWHGNDTLYGSAGADTLSGGDQHDFLSGGSGDDLLFGDRRKNPDELPKTEVEILDHLRNHLAFNDPGYSTWGLIYQRNYDTSQEDHYSAEFVRESRHDMIILGYTKSSASFDPNSEITWSADELTYMRGRNNKELIGYVNAAKINSFMREWGSAWTDTGIAKGVKTSVAPVWLGDIDGPFSGARKVSFWNAEWQELIKARINKMISDGYDGIFLDDVGMYFDFALDSFGQGTTEFNVLVGEYARSMRDFVISIRSFVDQALAEQRNAHPEKFTPDHFKIIVNGSPYILQDSFIGSDGVLLSEDEGKSAVLADSQSQQYLSSIDAVLVENYFKLGADYAVNYIADLFGREAGVPILSIDTDQATQQQQVDIITHSVNNGFIPYVTENNRYDTLNLGFLEQVLSSQPVDGSDTIEGGIGSDTIVAGAGDDSVTTGPGADKVELGPGEDTLFGEVTDFFDDEVTDFTISDEIVFLDQHIERNQITVTGDPVNVVIDSDGDGITDGSFSLGGDFASGDFMAIMANLNTVVTFENYLPLLADNTVVDPRSVNGIINQAFLTGDGSIGFRLTLDNAKMGAGFSNSIGVYEIDSDGNIVDVRMLVNDVKTAVGATVDITGVEAGNQLGFFIAQDGANWAGGLSAGDTFSFIDGVGGSNATTSGGSDVLLAVNGDDAGVTVFHSFDVNLNVDGVQHTLSGVDIGGQSITIGFEDLTGGGDLDYQDVVFSISIFDTV